ncbi:MATN2 [Branchiostoma lanceolatum]|uniref:MATN2 protein n=1 Tax=Branchiostoma lanceolatum TaxID=7740 RepID=A0A8J9YS30_BRALA|nr:MATN2 [Branchiostoma lanceolatum]
MAGHFVLMFVGVVVAAPFVTGSDLSASGAHVCSRQEAYQQQYTVPERASRTQVYYTSCWVFFTCTRYRTVYYTQQRAAVRTVYQAAYQCCTGWQQSGNSCPTPVCSNGCQNGGACTAPDVCACTDGFQGNRCQTDKNECSSGNGGCSQTCSNTRGSYVCSCQQGFVLDSDGRGCSDHDECAASDHGCQQRCLNSHGGYSCGCEDGYELDRNGRTCNDIDECASSPCSQICTQNAPGHGYQCSCADGYILEDDGTSCEPQCPQGCGNGGRCASPGVCECVRGFSGDACQEPVCDPPCENGGVCDAPDVCFCQPGFNGDQCQDDIDECTINNDNGGCAHNCLDERGSYRCECREGYVLDGNNKGCSDHDECAADDHGCDFCRNMEGSYRCYCGDGYVLGDDGKKCMDINECEGDNACEEICLNTNGSYACACLPGFYLDGNGINCLDHDECATHDHGCQHQCVNSRGFYSCQCHDGFLLQDDLKSCVDIDECAAEESPCGQICENSEGGYQCLCEDGYALIPSDPGQCKPVCDPPCAAGGHCTAPDTCKCSPGFAGTLCEIDIKARLAQSGDHWTKNSTGCQCYFDYSRFDCACCVDGGCQCTQEHPEQCVQCGYGHTCGLLDLAGVDGWTLSESGCQCPGGNRLNLSCPCCQNRGCPCTNDVPGRCAQCGREAHCEGGGGK